MRKLSLLIAFAFMVTIGGVYAAWNYAQGATASVEITREINMAQVNTTSNKGTISATPHDVAFIVDDDGTGTFTAKLVGTGNFDIKFTPSVGADATTISNGIKMIATVTLKTTSNALYEGDAPISLTSNNVIDITGGTASLTGNLTITQVLAAVEIPSVVLDTKAKNDAFHTALKDYTIVITISEVA